MLRTCWLTDIDRMSAWSRTAVELPPGAQEMRVHACLAIHRNRVVYISSQLLVGSKVGDVEIFAEVRP
jgi:hypothetical protein